MPRKAKLSVPHIEKFVGSINLDEDDDDDDRSTMNKNNIIGVTDQSKKFRKMNSISRIKQRNALFMNSNKRVIAGPTRSRSERMRMAGEMSSISSLTDSCSNRHSDYLAPLQVNVALTENLTCSYNGEGEMTVCKVEGVVQIQNKGGMSDLGIPFQMRLKDPWDHIKSVQENQKHIEYSRSSIFNDDEGHHLLKVYPPENNSYFPALRYKCAEDLRPHPIRVKTYMKLENNQRYVSVEIVTNPYIDGDFKNIEVFMGVDPRMIGENVYTQPVGGVWNTATRSIIWRVSSIGCGEKFQLNAKYEVAEHLDSTISMTDKEDTEPKIPVLIRCQCMRTQLSDTELELGAFDNPDLFPAGIKLKVAKRFRIIHQQLS